MEPSPSLTDEPTGSAAAPSPGSARGSAWLGLGLLLTASATFSTSGVFNTDCQRPSPLVGIGAVLALVGVALVLDVLGLVRIDGIGLAWSLAGTVGLAAHYVLPANAHKDLPPVAMAWAGMGIGSIALITAGRSGLVPFATSNADVHLVGHPVGWAWPIAGLVVLSGVIPYVTVTTGIRRLGARLSSFVGLTEMLFAILLAWALLGQSLTASQLLGAALTIAGIALVRYAEGPTDRACSVQRQQRTKAPRGPKSSRSAERSAAT